VTGARIGREITDAETPSRPSAVVSDGGPARVRQLRPVVAEDLEEALGFDRDALGLVPEATS